MDPVGGNGLITISDVDGGIIKRSDGKSVTSAINGQRETIIRRYIIVDRAVDVVEMESIGDAFEVFTIEQCKQRLQCRPPHRKHVRAAAVGPLNDRAGGKQPKRQTAVKRPPVSFLVVDIDYRTQPTAVLSRIVAFVEPDVLDRIRIKRGEEAEKVCGIVDCVAIKKDERLVRAASADVEAAGKVGGGFHAG